MLEGDQGASGIPQAHRYFAHVLNLDLGRPSWRWIQGPLETAGIIPLTYRKQYSGVQCYWLQSSQAIFAEASSVEWGGEGDSWSGWRIIISLTSRSPLPDHPRGKVWRRMVGPKEVRVFLEILFFLFCNKQITSKSWPEVEPLASQARPISVNGPNVIPTTGLV